MCTNSPDEISSKNILFLLEAVYKTFRQRWNQDLFVQRDCNVKSKAVTARMEEGSHFCFLSPALG